MPGPAQRCPRSGDEQPQDEQEDGLEAADPADLSQLLTALAAEDAN